MIKSIPRFPRIPKVLVCCLSFLAVAGLVLPAAAARIKGGNGALSLATSDRQIPAPSENSKPENWSHTSNAAATFSNSPVSPQATLVVNDNGDAADNAVGNGICDTSAAPGDQCTLRAAIQEANSVAGAETVTFGASLDNSTITLSTALPDVSSDMTIAGPGASSLTVQRSTAGGTPRFRIFTITGSTVNISGLTISNGHTADGTVGVNGDYGDFGGGVFNNGGVTLTLMDVTISGNATGDGAPGSDSAFGGYGGGIYNLGLLTFSNSTVSGNRTGNGNGTSGRGGQGGGIFNATTITITSSTIANNVTGNGPLGTGSGGGIAGYGNVIVTASAISGNRTGTSAHGGGGGIYSTGSLTASNTTLSGNQASAHGGGIFTFNSASLSNATVVNNRAGNIGGGLFHESGTVTLRNTLVAGNFLGTATTSDDIFGTVDPASSFNLIGPGGSGGLTNGTNNNQVGVLNPGLATLANNGGPTLTHALIPGSPAIDRGVNINVPSDTFDLDGDGNTSEPLPFDQRGTDFIRIVDGSDSSTTPIVDIGAYEKQTTSFLDLQDRSSNEDTTVVIPFAVTQTASITSIVATSSNTTLVPNNQVNINVTGTGVTRVLTIVPTANLFGTSDITITVNRSSSSDSHTFTLTVNPVNDAPSFTKGPDQSVNENSSAQPVANWATNISAGPPNESGQTLTFQLVDNSDPVLFAVAPAISPGGTLTYTPAARRSGSATITVAIMDSGGTENGGNNTSTTQSFLINVLDGGSLQFANNGGSQVESAGTVTIFTVVRTGGSAGEARIDYATSDGTATAGADYIATSGTLIFPEGVTSRTISATIIDDTLDEQSPETVIVTLSNVAGTGDQGSPGSSSFSIFDNDPQPGMRIDDVSVTEGSSGTTNAVFDITLSAASAFTVTANFATSDSSATAPSDYLSTDGLVTFNPGELTKTISVTVNGDNTPELHESFFVNLSNTTNSFPADSQGVATILSDDAPGGTITFDSPGFEGSEFGDRIVIFVEHTGDTSSPVTVDYATSDGTASMLPCSSVSGFASARCDFTSAFGTLHIPAGQSLTTFVVLVTKDSLMEGPETFTITLSNPTGGAVLGGSSSTTSATLTITELPIDPNTNPIDNARDFVRQHYHDFLNREADPDGLDFWVNQIASCGTDQQCIDIKRINVSAAFYLSIEFQETGYLAERMYKIAYGDALGTSSQGGLHQFPVPVIRLNEFLTDAPEIARGVVVGLPGWEQVLENNKQSFVARFVQRARFTSAFPTTLTESQFVDRLDGNAGGVLLPAERIQLITDLSAGTKTRAQVVRMIAEDSDLVAAERNRAFVLMQYFGYLRRNPNDSPDPNHTGYEFWLNKLNQFGGNFVNAEMVKAFIISGEYRQRFGP